jgi:hypothetical protein
MHIERTRQVDASEPDETGMFEYYYEYDIYRFTDGPICLVARIYTDEPDEAHFLRIESNGSPRSLVDSDLTHPLLLAAQAHLHTEGKRHLRWLSGRGNGYELVPPGPLHRA